MIKRMVSWLKTLYFLFRAIGLRVRVLFFVSAPSNFKRVPIIINNFNRLECLKKQLDALQKRGYTNIYIIDNKSTYPPLLEFYQTTEVTVFRLEDNLGYLAFWQSGIYKQFKNQYFVLTDSDVIPVEECPDNFLEYFYSLMQKYWRTTKVGFALKTDDLPTCFANRDKVIEWEGEFWSKPLEKDVYRAAIDTTFALYFPNVRGGAYFHDFMIRTAGIYSAKHLPWYNDDSNLSDEELYYINNAKTSTHWTRMSKVK